MDVGLLHAWYMGHSVSSSDSLHAVDISVIPILEGKKLSLLSLSQGNE